MIKTSRVVFVCHRHPFMRQGGAEKSVTTIMRRFVALGHEVMAVYPGAKDQEAYGITLVGGGIESLIQFADIVFTWGSVAENCGRLCVKHSTPFVLMVRWWRNVVDVSQGVGDLRTRKVGTNTYKKNKPLFDNSMAVVTNNYYSHGVIKRLYRRGALVSYVPIEGPAKKINRAGGCIAIISPDKDLGEKRLILDLAASMPGHEFLLVNVPDYDRAHYKRQNITIWEKVENMETVWEKSAFLLAPIYKNDICGTLRVTIEAQQHGVVVIANDRCGLGEKVHNLVPYNATVANWIEMIITLELRYEMESAAAIRLFEEYNTPAQLKIFEDLL